MLFPLTFQFSILSGIDCHNFVQQKFKLNSYLIFKLICSQWRSLGCHKDRGVNVTMMMMLREMPVINHCTFDKRSWRSLLLPWSKQVSNTLIMQVPHSMAIDKSTHSSLAHISHYHQQTVSDCRHFQCLCEHTSHIALSH